MTSRTWRPLAPSRELGGSAVATRGTTPGIACLSLLGVAVAIALRVPAIWPDGRLWAEEAQVYFANAWHDPWYRALVAVHTGYINLPAAAATALAAHLVPLEQVPLVTVLFALLMQLLPAVVLLVSGIGWLRSWPTMLAALLLIVLPPFAEEVWLNTITSQFHILLAVALILASIPRAGGIGLFQGTILLLAPLCGPSAAIMLPLFALRAWSDRAWRRAVQAVLLLPGAAAQVLVFLAHPEQGRSGNWDPGLLLASITGKQILLPLFGPARTAWLTDGLVAAFTGGHLPVGFILAPLLVFGALGLAVVRAREPSVLWLYASCILIMVGVYLGALTPNGKHELLLPYFGLRYYYVPAVLAGLTLLGIAATGTGVCRIIAGGLVAWLLLAGARDYLRPVPGGPSWVAEVARWRADPSYALAVWPVEGPRVMLEPR